MIHVRRYFAALGVLLSLFGTYALAVAPWIAPPPIKTPAAKASSAPVAVTPTIDAELERLFPPEAWERNGAKIIETDRCTLIIRDYEPTPDGKLLLKPCTLIMHTGSQAAKRPIVMQAPQGAELTFDRALDIGRAQFGRLLEGELSGAIRIFSPPTTAAGRDALELTTSDVQLKENVVFTDKEVAFRYGDSAGRGRYMRIDLLAKTDATGDKNKPSWSGIQSLTLEHIEQLRIASAGGGLLGKSPPDTTQGSTLAGAHEWIEVSCAGEFRFDMLSQVAQFDKDVEVRRLAPNGPPDRLRCNTLFLGFGAPEKAGRTANATADDPLAGRLQKITAVGSPATLEAPASGVEASAAVMEYSLADRRITLQPDNESRPNRRVTRVSLRQFGQHFTASELHYEMGAGDRLGKLWAAGPGELRLLQGRGAARQTVIARWEKELRIQPQERNQVISLVGAASVTVDPLGRFDADELHFWVLEIPVQGSDGKEQMTILPDRLKATGGVKLSSLQLDADTSQLEAWFTNLPPDPVEPPREPGEPVREPVSPAGFFAGSPPPVGPSPNPGAGLLPASENGSRGAGLLPAIGHSTQQAVIRDVIRAPNLQKFNAAGGLIQMRLVVRGRKFDLEDLTIRGHAVIDEIRTPEPGQEPIRIAGERIEVRGGTTAEATCQVHGEPAEVGGRGLSLAGNVVQVHRGQNRMWIDGPGEATLPAPSDQALLPGGGGTGGEAERQPMPHPAGPPQKMHLVWNRQFNFDGLTARFEGEIVARTSTQTAHGHALEVRLAPRLDFAATGKQPPPEVARVDLVGGPSGVYLDSRGLDERGEQVSREQMLVRNLTIDRLAGKLHGEGPGWVSTVRRAGTLPAGMPPTSNNERVSADGEAPLTSVHVAFDRAIEGDLARRQIWFRDRVRTTYSPANDFSDLIEANKPGDLGERGLLMTSDKLTLTEMIVSGRRWFEAQATDRVIAEGKSLTVEAASIRYTSDKEVLTIEGSTRTPIHGWHTAVVGQRPTTIRGQKVSYHLRSGQLEADSIDRIEFDLNGGLKLPGR